MALAGKIVCVVALILTIACSGAGDSSRSAAASDPLSSWNHGDAKTQILDFVERVTDPASPDFVPGAACPGISRHTTNNNCP